MLEGNILKARVEKVIAEFPNSENDCLETTDWLYDETRDEVEKIISEFEVKYETFLKEVIRIIGKPTYNERTNRAQIDEWYPEALAISCWEMADKVFFLALEQHDRETPVGILIGCRTKDEIQELKG